MVLNHYLKAPFLLIVTDTSASISLHFSPFFLFLSAILLFSIHLPEYNPFSWASTHIWIWRQQQSFSVSETHVRLRELLMAWHFKHTVEGLKSACAPHALRAGLVCVGVWNQSVQARSSPPRSISPLLHLQTEQWIISVYTFPIKGSCSQSICGVVWGREMGVGMLIEEVQLQNQKKNVNVWSILCLRVSDDYLANWVTRF